MELVFDLDGTLIDSSPGILSSLTYMFREMGFAVLSETDMKTFIGPPLIPALMEKIHIDEPTAARALEVYRADYRINGLTQVRVYDGIPSALERLVAAGHTLHVATSKPEEFANTILQGIDLHRYFTHICGATFDNSRVKKSDVLRELFRRGHVDCPCRENLTNWRMIGDRIFDVEGAAAFGMASVGVLWGFGTMSEFTAAEHISADPDDLVCWFTQ